MRIVFLTLTLIVALAGASCPAFAARLPTEVVPTSQEISLDLDPREPDYSGTVRISLAATEGASRFALHAELTAIDTLILRNKRGEVPVTWQMDPGLLTITTTAPLSAGDYELEIDFRNSFGTRATGLYRMETEGEWYAFTQFQSDDAREALPCFDEPAFKIPWQFVIRAPQEHMVVTNTVAERDTVIAGFRETTFRRTPPMSSYLLAIAVGPLEAVDVPGMSVPGRVVTVKGRSKLARYAVEATPPLLAALERWFDSPYPFEKLDLIAVPEFWPGAMENAGAITFAEGILLVDPRTAGTTARSRQVTVIAHELAHMWFGDLVTMAWWDDLWLNESFASWMGDKIAGETFPEFRVDVTGMEPVLDVMRADARPSTPPIRRPTERSDGLLENVTVVYHKGKAVLDMFEQWTGAEAFRRGVNTYLAEHQWGSATSADLWSALGGASGRDIAGAMSTFLDQGGIPLLRLEPTEGGRFVVSQERFSNYGAPSEGTFRWQIPMTLKYRLRGDVRTQQILLTEERQVVTLDPEERPDWVMPAAEGIGYYRWRLPADMLLALTNTGLPDLSAREKMVVLGNVAALLDAGVLGGAEYVRIVGGFGADPDPQVVGAVLDQLEIVERAFVSDDLRPAFARYVRTTLAPAKARFGFERKADEAESVSLLRPRLLEWLADEGADEEALAWSESKARAFLTDPESVDPALVSVVIELAAIRGDRALYEECRRRFEAAETSAQRRIYLAAMGSFRQPALTAEALQYVLKGPLRPQEIMVIPRAAGSVSEEGAGRGFEWMRENYAFLANRVPPGSVAFFPMAASGCSTSRLAEARRFFEEPGHSVPGTDTSLERVTDQVNDCAGLRRREGGSVAAYLRSLRASR